MKLNQLVYFQKVCECGNITRAAERLNISQPSISNAIREIENEFNIDLFYRMGNKLLLTKAGEIFLEGADEIIRDAENLTMTMKNLSSDVGSIRIGIPPMIGNILLPDLFLGFQLKNPKINIQMVESGSLATTHLVEENVIDAAIVVANTLNVEQFNHYHIFDTQLLYVCSTEHKYAKEPYVSMEMLREEPVIFFGESSCQTVVMKERFRAAGIEPRVVLTSLQLSTILKFARQGGATSFLFKETIDPREGVVGIPLEEPVDIQVDFIWEKRKHMGNEVIQFLEYMREIMA